MSRTKHLRVVDGALEPSEAAKLLDQVHNACADETPSTIHRAHGDRPLHYQVIDGLRAARELPEIASLLTRFRPLAQEWYGAELVPLAKPTVAVNVNITPPGGTYRWHYDRNAVTLLLYLNEVAGGGTEVCPGYRFELPSRLSAPRLQEAFDAILRTRALRQVAGRPVVIAPEPGRMVMMRGRRCLHSVQPVLEGSPTRVVVVLSFDRPGRSVDPGSALDDYLYDAKTATEGDPNYSRR